MTHLPPYRHITPSLYGVGRGLELAFQRVPGVVDTSVGYTQGSLDKPTYGEVCSGKSGHTEAVQVLV